MLDPGTISFIMGITIFVLGCVFMLGGIRSNRYAGTLAMSISYLLIACGHYLVAFQGKLPAFFSIVLANTFLIGGYCFISCGLRLFLENKPVKPLYYIFLTLITFLFMYYYSILTNMYFYRVIFISLIFLIIFIECSYVLFKKCKIDALKNTCNYLASIFLVFVFLNLIRIYAVLSAPEFRQGGLFAGTNKMLTSFFLISGLIIFLITFCGFVSMLNIRLENDIIEREKSIKLYADRLSEMNDAKNKFFTIISHDLRGAIGGIKELLGIKAEAEKSSISDGELDRVMHASAERTYNLLENLLEWAKTQMNDMEYKPENIDIRQIIDECINFEELRLRKKNISVKHNIAYNGYVIADKNMIMTIIRNLLSNAIKFTNLNGQIIFSVAKNEENIEVAVTDNGVGIDGALIEKLFKINQMCRVPGTAGELGSGLGLILCKEFAEKNNGDIWVKSEPGSGSVFTLRLPLAIDATAKTA